MKYQLFGHSHTNEKFRLYLYCGDQNNLMIKNDQSILSQPNINKYLYLILL